MPSPDIRVFAITAASADALNGTILAHFSAALRLHSVAVFGAWDRVEALRTKEFDTMQVWDGMGSGFMRFGGDGQGRLGWIVENAVLQCAVDDSVAELSGKPGSNLHCFEGESVKKVLFPHMDGSSAHQLAAKPSPELSRPKAPHFVTGGQKPQVQLESGPTLTSNLVVRIGMCTA